MATICIISGPNLNLLGRRESGHYGPKTLKQIEDDCKSVGAKLGVNIDCFQSNYEGGIIEKIHSLMEIDAKEYLGLILNLGAYTHTSIGCLDAVKSLRNVREDSGTLSLVEVHLSNIFAREAFRKKSYISSEVDAVISGMRDKGYIHAINYIYSQYRDHKSHAEK